MKPPSLTWVQVLGGMRQASPMTSQLVSPQIGPPNCLCTPPPMPKAWGEGGGRTKGSDGCEASCGQGGCTGAMVDTPCAYGFIYISGRPPDLHFIKCPYLLQIRRGLISMAFQSSPSILTLPGLPFNEGSMD
jgi:hypothetical protein